MRTTLIAAALAATLGAAAATLAQMPVPGARDVTRIAAGTYQVDPAHTQVAWSVNHFGFNVYHGLFGDVTGTLVLDPARPAAATVSIEVPIAKVVTTSDGLNKHLMTPDFFDVAKHPTASFRSTRVTVNGTTAQIAGNLTLRGVTKPVVLDARFIGAGANPMNKKATVGFEATTRIKRSDFGIAYGIPAVADEVDLRITAAFERAS